MSPLTHFKVYPAILRLSLSRTQKDLLCLIITFADKGLKMSNEAIGECLNISPHTVKNAFTKLRRRGLIETEKEQSKYRRIHSNKHNLLSLLRSQVDSFYFPDSVPLLSLSLGKLLSLQEGYISKESKRKKDSGARDAQPGGEPPPNGEGFKRFWSEYPNSTTPFRFPKCSNV